MNAIASQQISDNNETISAFDIPSDPGDPNIVYFSTVTTGNNIYDNIIHSYNLKTGEMKKVMTEISSSQTGDVLWRTVGLEEAKLIVMYDKSNSSPAPCFSYWADWKDFGYFDLNTPTEGLKPFTVPSYKVEEARQEQQKCLTNLAAGQ